ncbi:hypothetical protein THAOC_31403 [Thalassiosira oceanica]|uniref:Uncharacterized protein n=1 Tax=Thalassiosira oceanica TaxID=159749 RepID=K0RBU9_THAOC|nr:hypothetical protein THAOC_31403 [Thalassiosira oceanica]|eukprot:EJK49694.1 hypothetical protein THAOC_31403 [Thalassiosira oceanica]
MVELTPGRRNGGLAAAAPTITRLPTSIGRLPLLGAASFRPATADFRPFRGDLRGNSAHQRDGRVGCGDRCRSSLRILRSGDLDGICVDTTLALVCYGLYTRRWRAPLRTHDANDTENGPIGGVRRRRRLVWCSSQNDIKAFGLWRRIGDAKQNGADGGQGVIVAQIFVPGRGPSVGFGEGVALELGPSVEPVDRAEDMRAVEGGIAGPPGVVPKHPVRELRPGVLLSSTGGPQRGVQKTWGLPFCPKRKHHPMMSRTSQTFSEMGADLSNALKWHGGGVTVAHIAKVVNDDPARGCAARAELSLFGRPLEVCCRCQEVQQTPVPTSNSEYLLQAGAASKVEQARSSK